MSEFSLNLTLMYLFSFGLMSAFAFTEFEEEFLKLHNDYREKHKAPPLKLNQEICDYAKKRAEACAEEGGLSHLPPSERIYGENLYSGSKEGTSLTKADAKEIVDYWYEEIKDYDFKTGNAIGNKPIGHFTQIVWKSSQELGVGVAFKDGSLYVAANYKPPGNMPGTYVENVLSDGNLTLVNMKVLIISFLIVNAFAFI